MEELQDLVIKATQREDGSWDVDCSACERPLVVAERPKKVVICRRCFDLRKGLREASDRGFRFGV